MIRAIIVFLLVVFLFSGISNAFAEVPSDIPKDHWAYEAVETLIREGLMKGYPDGTFKGNQNLTRYELAMIIYRLLELIKASSTKVESQESKVKAEPQITQSRETKLSIKRREIPPNAYTGLVIDARGFKVGRSMSPKIYDIKGKEIYGPSIFAKENRSLDIGIVIEWGVVEYIKDDGTDLNERIKNSRAGPKPLIIKAIGTQGEFNDSIIVSEEDGNLILREDEISKFLEDMAIVIAY